MKIQSWINLFLLLLCISLLFRSFDVENQIPQPINYKIYEYRFNQQAEIIDSLRLLVNAFEQKTDTIKLQILRDETTIKNLDNNGIDSAFAVLLQSTK